MPGFRPSSVVIHPDVHASYDAVEKAAKQGRQPDAAIWKSLQTAVTRVKVDAQWGEVIPKTKIPKHFTREYGAKNLYCVDLAKFHRAFYTIINRDVVFLDLVDHATYDKWFPNKGK